MVSFTRDYLPCFLTESVTGLELVKQAGLVGSDPWGSPCLHFPSAGITNKHHHTFFPIVDSGD